jgi:hypothetical protein
VVKHFVSVAAVVAIASAGVSAAGRQDARGQDGRQAPAADASREQQVQARYNIFMMEGVLERAVQHGADQLRRQVQRLMPDMMMLSGEAHARGFRLEGYGVFFDVSVPIMRQTVAWSLRTFIHDNHAAAGAALQQLKTAIERMTPDPREKAALLQAIKRLEVQVTPLQSGAGPVVTGMVPRQTGERGTVTALEAAPEAAAPALTPEQVALLEDPNGAYEREVIAALKDAMLQHSGSIRVGADEWLTVAAHDNEHRNRLVPGEAYDLLTIVLRVKGSDLADYRAERISADEARRRIVVSEF